MAGRFLIAFDTLALRATACALSVTAYAVPPLPKGEARSAPVMPLALPLGELLSEAKLRGRGR